MIGYYINEINTTIIDATYTVSFCEDPLNCFFYVVNIGLRAGGGVGDSKIPLPHSRASPLDSSLDGPLLLT